MTLAPVSILIPNYNGADIIASCLPAVVGAADAYRGECEVVLVDDASTDESVKVVSSMGSGIRLIRHKVNRGFSEAVHSGIEAARHDRIILLNSDVRPDADFVAPLIKALDDETVFATSPLVLDGEGEPQFVSWTRYRIVRGKLKARPWGLQDAQEMRARGRSLPALYASGGSVAFTRARFLALGGFLDVYKPFYSEDLDLCTRAWMRGWKTLFVPESRVTHAGAGTIKRLFPAQRVRTTRIRNRLVFLSLYADGRRFFFSYLPWNFLRAITRLLRLDATMLAAFLQLAGMRPRLVDLRKRIRAEQPFRTLEQILDEIAATTEV